MPQPRLFIPGGIPGPPGPSGLDVLPALIPGKYYDNLLGLTGLPDLNFDNGAITGLNSNKLLFFPVFINTAVTVNQMGFYQFQVAAGGSGADACTLGIYDDLNYSPNNLLVESAPISLAGPGGALYVTVSQVLAVGWYWIAILTNTFDHPYPPIPGPYGDAVRIGNCANNSTAAGAPYRSPFTGAADANVLLGIQQTALQFGAMPATPGPLSDLGTPATNGGFIPRIVFRV